MCITTAMYLKNVSTTATRRTSTTISTAKTKTFGLIDSDARGEYRPKMEKTWVVHAAIKPTWVHTAT